MKQEKPFPDETASAAAQARFLNAVQGIGDILVFDTKRRNQNKEVLESLKKLADLVRDLFAIRDRDPKKFDRMVLAQRLFKLFHENPQEAGLNLAFDPKRSLISFSTALAQIMRVHEAALEVSNDEISRHATYHLVWLLADLSKRRDCAIFIEQILRELSSVMRAAVKKEDSSAYSAASDWYVDIVLKGMKQDEGEFLLDYLELFDRYLFYTAEFVITAGHRHLFESLVSSLIDGVIMTHDGGAIWNYGHIFFPSKYEQYKEIDAKHGVEKRLQELSASERMLDSKEKLDSWLSKFKELKSLLSPYFSEADAKRALEIEKEVREQAIEGYKHNNLLVIVFKIGAYALARNRPDYIRHLWEYKQPPDSDAEWIGHDIVPTTLPGILELYFRPELLHPVFSRFEGHRSLSPYIKKYFLLLLSRLLQGETNPAHYDFTGWSASRLNGIASALRDLVPLAESLALETELVSSLGIDKKQAEELFRGRLVELLSAVAASAEFQVSILEREQPVSPKKVLEFRELVLKEYERLASIRSILNLHGRLFDHSAEENTTDLPLWGLKTADSKAAFFDEWYVSYIGWGTKYGERMAISEDTSLSNRMAERCLKINPVELDATIAVAGPDAIILATRLALLSFQTGNHFQPEWNINPAEKPKASGFEGWYTVGERKIPVYEVRCETARRRVLVLSSAALGELHQYSPLDPGDDAGAQVKHLLIDVVAYSEDLELAKKTLAEPPPWLRAIEDETSRLDHLKERVLIRICERYALRLPENFTGWVYDAPGK